MKTPYLMMTPGPTPVQEPVLQALSRPYGNADLDLDFVEFYHETCVKLSHMLGTEHETILLSGEGILALEAACATLTEPGDQVLVLDNGIYGHGFADFVTMYGGVPTLYTQDYRETLDPKALESFLQQNHDFKYATVVHCDTPSGLCNDVATLCPLLKRYGIMTVVDSVSAMFGEPMDVDAYEIDVLCGGSQKAISAPPGLAFVTVSPDAWHCMNHRQTPVAAFYANLLLFAQYYENKWFPYTMPIHDIYAFRAALDTIAPNQSTLLEKHARLAAACRGALEEVGLELYPRSGTSNTVTAFLVPPQTTGQAILTKLLDEYHIMLAGAFDVLAGKVIRIGHMGSNCNANDLQATMIALHQVFTKLGVPLTGDLGVAFARRFGA